MEVDLLHLHRKWVWWKCAFWCCPGCAVLVALFVDFRWASGGQSKFVGVYMGVLEEQDGTVVGVLWPLPSGPASGSLGILNAHFQL